MNHEPLSFSHPVDRLKLYDLNPEKWDFRQPPELFEVRRSTVAPYMPALWMVEVVEGKPRVEHLGNGQCRFFFELTQEINYLWELFFERHRHGADVAFEGKILILRCSPNDLQKNYDAVCHGAIHQATNDYRTERQKLVWLVFPRMKEQERRERIEAEIQAEMEIYKQKRQERTLFAKEKGWSVPFFVQNFNEHYKEILETKFNWWSRVLDSATIRKYQALFAAEALIV
jgi:hypothetical protein